MSPLDQSHRTRDTRGCFQAGGVSDGLISPEERFWQKVDKNGPIVREELGPCWLWTAGKDHEGYGVFRLDGKAIHAQRAAWIFKHGPYELDVLKLDVLHRCDVRACVNNEGKHLFTGTQTDNNRDMTEKGRRRWASPENHRYITHLGEEHGMAKLTNNQVREIRLAASVGATHRGQARLYNVSSRMIKRIVMLDNWKHVT